MRRNSDSVYVVCSTNGTDVLPVIGYRDEFAAHSKAREMDRNNPIGCDLRHVVKMIAVVN